MTESGRAATRARICSLDFCNNKHYSRDYCRAHYEQVQRGNTPHPVSEYTNETAECAAPDCNNEFQQRLRGSKRLYCSRTCKDRIAKQELRADGSGWVPAHKRPTAPRCSVAGCAEARFSWDMCVMHYTRVKANGDPGEAGRRKARPGEGEWRVNGDGYVVRCVNGQIELQHRVVMEEHIGRALWPDETVHHKHGVRHDNRIEKLELWSTAQPAGQRVTDKLAWAREIIARYGDLPPEVIE